MDRLEIPKGIRGRELTEHLEHEMREFIGSIITDPVKLTSFVDLWSSNLGMHQYSINNVILAFRQYPRVSMLAGFRKWEKLNRTIIKGSKAIKILAPLQKKVKTDEECSEDYYAIYGWKYVNVFDVNQTKGEEPLEFGHSDKVKGLSDVSFEQLTTISPLPVKIRYNGTSNGSISPEKIVIAPKKSESAMIACLCHELSHYYLQHLESDLDRETKEQEAEICSFLICSYLGLDNEKAKYYAGVWKGSDKIKVRGPRIIAAAEKIIRKIESI
ncbi:MAG: hypothetical protein CVV29_06540 [Methanobacteriales archaeon HGW-Methanobacteriales-2]|nr:MAG: hypothetical protein CVV29_06540 [Methanobacteriales archaeon HGW-Methanobacteriales-2]